MRGVLIDTSVWVDHFRRRNDVLVGLLDLDLGLTHPMVLVELGCGTLPPPRARTLGDMGLLQQTQQASLREVMDFIEREKLYGLGCGLVDMVCWRQRCSHRTRSYGHWTSVLGRWPRDSA